MKTKLSVLLAFVAFSALVGSSAEAEPANPWETADHGTAICRVEWKGKRYFSLLGNGAFLTLADDNDLTDGCGGLVLAQIGEYFDELPRFKKVAWCAHEGAFYTELCKAEETSVITTLDLENLADGEILSGIDDVGSSVVVWGVATREDVMG